MFSWNKIINALKRSRGNINPFTTFKPSGWKCYRTIGSYVSCAFIEIWNTGEVWRARKMRESCARRISYTLSKINTELIIGMRYSTVKGNSFIYNIFRNFERYRKRFRISLKIVKLMWLAVCSQLRATVLIWLQNVNNNIFHGVEWLFRFSFGEQNSFDMGGGGREFGTFDSLLLLIISCYISYLTE